MFDYNQIIQNRQRQEEIARLANAPETEGWTRRVPGIFDLLFTAMKRPKQPAAQAKDAVFNWPALSK